MSAAPNGRHTVIENTPDKLPSLMSEDHIFDTESLRVSIYYETPIIVNGEQLKSRRDLASA